MLLTKEKWLDTKPEEKWLEGSNKTTPENGPQDKDVIKALLGWFVGFLAIEGILQGIFKIDIIWGLICTLISLFSDILFLNSIITNFFIDIVD